MHAKKLEKDENGSNSYDRVIVAARARLRLISPLVAKMRIAHRITFFANNESKEDAAARRALPKVANNRKWQQQHEAIEVERMKLMESLEQLRQRFSLTKQTDWQTMKHRLLPSFSVLGVSMTASFQQLMTDKVRPVALAPLLEQLLALNKGLHSVLWLSSSARYCCTETLISFDNHTVSMRVNRGRKFEQNKIGSVVKAGERARISILLTLSAACAPELHQYTLEIPGHGQIVKQPDDLSLALLDFRKSRLVLTAVSHHICTLC